jgi:hypothetical protein
VLTSVSDVLFSIFLKINTINNHKNLMHIQCVEKAAISQKFIGNTQI